MMRETCSECGWRGTIMTIKDGRGPYGSAHHHCPNCCELL